MEDRRRLILAIALMVGVVVLPSILFPPSVNQPPVPAVDPAVIEQPSAPATTLDSVAMAPVPTTPSIDAAPVESTESAVSVGERTVTVVSDLFEYRFTSHGARLVGATLLNYETLKPGTEGPANILPDDSDFLATSFVFGRDTLPVSDWQFEPSTERLDVTDGPAQLTWVAQRGRATIRLTYTFEPDRYLFRVQGRLEGLPADNPLMVVNLGPGLRSVEVDSTEDFRAFGVVTRSDNTENLKFSSLDPGEFEELPGPFDWIAVKSKYFLAAILAVEEGQPRFGGGLAKGLEESGGRQRNWKCGLRPWCRAVRFRIRFTSDRRRIAD